MLKRKMLRDLRALKGQFFAIFFMCFLGTFVFSGIYSEWKGMDNEAKQLYEKTNLADGWIYGTFENDDFLKDVHDITAYESRLLLPAQVEGKNDHQLQVFAVDEGGIDQIMVQEGIPYDANTEGVWLDMAYAQSNNLELGDHITFVIQGMKQTEVIQGLVYHPLYVYALKDASSFMPDHETFGFAFISKRANTMLEMLPYNQISLKTSANAEDWKAQVREVLPNKNAQLYAQNEHYSVKTVQEEIDQHRSIGTVLPLVFLLVALLSTLNTMRKVIMNQRIQIGTLKAVGFTNKQLYLHYTSHVMLLCITGTMSGAILGVMVLPSIIYDMQKTMYCLPEWKASVDALVLVVSLMIIFSCMIAGMSAVNKTLKEVAASLLRGKVESNHSTSLTFAHLPNIGKQTFYIRWNLRDIFRNKTRSFLALFGIMGCSGLLLCSLGLMDSIHHMIAMQYEYLHTYESRIQLDDAIDEERIQQLIEQYHGEGIQEQNIEMKVNGEEKTIPLTVMESTNFIHFDKENKLALPTNGVYVSQKLAQQYHIAVGDTITWRTLQSSTWQTSTIIDLVITPLSQGIFTSVEEYEKVGYNYQANTIVSAVTQVKESAGIVHVQYRADLLSTMNQMLEAMMVLVGILILAALVLGTIVLYNFTSLTFFERTREIATLKVLGFDNKRARKISRTQNEILCFFGIVLGIPFGYILLSFMATTLSESMDLQVQITGLSYCMSMVFTWSMMWLVTFIVNRHIKRIDMVSALKEME